MEQKKFLRKLDGYNIYFVPDFHGRTHLVAYLNRKKMADELYVCESQNVLDLACQHLINIAKQKVSRT